MGAAKDAMLDEQNEPRCWLCDEDEEGLEKIRQREKLTFDDLNLEEFDCLRCAGTGGEMICTICATQEILCSYCRNITDKDD